MLQTPLPAHSVAAIPESAPPSAHAITAVAPQSTMHAPAHASSVHASPTSHTPFPHVPLRSMDSTVVDDEFGNVAVAVRVRRVMTSAVDSGVTAAAATVNVTRTTSAPPAHAREVTLVAHASMPRAEAIASRAAAMSVVAGAYAAPVRGTANSDVIAHTSATNPDPDAPDTESVAAVAHSPTPPHTPQSSTAVDASRQHRPDALVTAQQLPRRSTTSPFEHATADTAAVAPPQGCVLHSAVVAGSGSASHALSGRTSPAALTHVTLRAVTGAEYTASPSALGSAHGPAHAPQGPKT